MNWLFKYFLAAVLSCWLFTGDLPTSTAASKPSAGEEFVVKKKKKKHKKHHKKKKRTSADSAESRVA